MISDPNSGHSVNYQEQVKLIFQKLFAQEKPEDPHFRSSLTSSIVQAFHLQMNPPSTTKKVSSEEKALIILDQLFTCWTDKYSPAYPFRFFLFITNARLKKTEIKRFVTSILYGLYYGDFDLRYHQIQNHRFHLTFFMIELLAENVSKQRIISLLQEQSLDELVGLLCFAFNYYREGSYPILNVIEELASQKYAAICSLKSQHLIITLIRSLRNKYYSLDELFKQLMSIPPQHLNEVKLEQIVEHLEKYAIEQVRQIKVLFDEIIPLIIESPIRLYQEVESLKKQLLGDSYIVSREDREAAEKNQKDLEQRFSHYSSTVYDLKAFLDFARVFGLEGYPARYQMEGDRKIEKLLLDKLRSIHLYFSTVSLLIKKDLNEVLAYLSFMLTIILHMDSMQHKPNRYNKGLERMISVIPTKGKKLIDQASIHSILKGLGEVVEYLNLHDHECLHAPLHLKNYPLYVFDQSDKSLFRKNRIYINRLNKKYDASVVHVSKDEAFSLAEKLGIGWAIKTSRTGLFGYGGARNCVFLLAPVLKRAFAMGKRTLDKVLEIPAEELQAFFRQGVLGEVENSNGSGDPLFMSDDDMEIPESNLFSHLLYVEELGGLYAVIVGYCYGRVTKYGIKYRTLEQVLNAPLDTFDYAKWSDLPILVMMSEVICKPRICLNLPLGHEETHLLTHAESNPVSKPSIHLGGTRYPTHQLPTHYFVGLEEHLINFIPYALGISMISSLLDPGDHYERCALPWNDMGARSSYTCLKEVFVSMKEESSKNEMQRRFWRHIDEFLGSKCKLTTFQDYLDALLCEDIQNVIETFKKKHQLSRKEKISLEKIEDLYLFFQRDAKMLKEFGVNVVTEIKRQLGVEVNWYDVLAFHTLDISALITQSKEWIENRYQIQFLDYSLTENFYLLLLAIGCGEFNQHIEETLRLQGTAH